MRAHTNNCLIDLVLSSTLQGGGHLHGPTGSALDRRSLPPKFEPRRGHI